MGGMSIHIGKKNCERSNVCMKLDIVEKMKST